MDYKDEIISCINRLYVDAIEEFREAEVRIANDSKFRRVFTKKDYKGNISMLKKCRETANGIVFPVDRIPDDDSASIEIVRQGQECIRLFSKLCDSYISMQVALDKKAKGEDLPYNEYKRVYQQAMKNHAAANGVIKELDLLYADYAEDSEEIGEGYMTYDMIAGGEGE